MTSRQTLRKRIRARRRAMSTRQRRHAAESTARILASSTLFRRSGRIAFYWPVDGELDVRPLMERAWMLKKSCYLPILDTLNYDSLWFAPCLPDERFILNRFGIPEPDRPIRQRVRARCLDLVLAPLVAFDSNGNRLGMGGGFYDRTLAFLNRRRIWRTPALVGMAYEFQRVDTLTRQPWDVPLSAVATEGGFYRVHR